MNDSMELIIGNRVISRILAYAVDANIYNAAGAFQFSVNPDYHGIIKKGDRAVIKINGKTILTGLVDNPRMRGSKSKNELIVYGRDLMGLVVDWHIETFRSLKNKTLAQVAELYLRAIPFVRESDIVFLDGAANLDIAGEYIQPQPGQTVFELLSGIAAARGLHFYMLPDGTMVFGKPKGYGATTFEVWRADGGSNVIDWDYNDDLSQQFSRITVTGQSRDEFGGGMKTVNKKATVTDPDFPFEKPLVVMTDREAKTPQEQARMVLEQQRIAGFNLSYTVGGHTQRGNIWTVGALCSVEDSRLQMRDKFVIYGRSFQLSKRTKSTRILLGKPGVTA